MKLKLDKKNLACMVLTVTEDVTLRDIQVLRSGFRKLLGSGARTAFLIDMSFAIVDPDTENALMAIQLDAVAAKIRLVIIGPHETFCQAPNLKEAQTLLTSVTKLDKVLNPQLITLHASLLARKTAATAILDNPVPEENPPTVLKENVQLKSQVDSLVSQLEDLLKEHKPVTIPKETLKSRAEHELKIQAELEERRMIPGAQK